MKATKGEGLFLDGKEIGSVGSWSMYGDPVDVPPVPDMSRSYSFSGSMKPGRKNRKNLRKMAKELRDSGPPFTMNFSGVRTPDNERINQMVEIMGAPVTLQFIREDRRLGNLICKLVKHWFKTSGAMSKCRICGAVQARAEVTDCEVSPDSMKMSFKGLPIEKGTVGYYGSGKIKDAE